MNDENESEDDNVIKGIMVAIVPSIAIWGVIIAVIAKVT